MTRPFMTNYNTNRLKSSYYLTILCMCILYKEIDTVLKNEQQTLVHKHTL